MEDEEIKKLLKKNLEISEESFKILKKMRRSQAIGRAFQVFKWLLIIAFATGFYYFAQPYIINFWDTYREITESLSGMKDLPFLSR